MDLRTLARMRRIALAVSVALAALTGSATAAPPADAARPQSVDIEGNLVLVDEVYLAILDLPEALAATPANAAEVADQIRRFLRRAGYEIASAKGEVIAGRIRVTVDEGRLARIVVVGQDVVTSIAIRLTAELPYNVFNKPQLERLLRPFQRDRTATRYRLVPVKNVEHVGPQLDPMALLPGGAPSDLSPGAYELLIDFSGGRPRRSLSIVAGVDNDSIRAGGELKGPSGLIRGDRWELESQVGANYFEDLRRQASELKFSRVFGDARWLAPALVRGIVRPGVRLRNDLVRRQRKDLLVESYWWNRLEGAFALAVEPRKGLELVAELGLQRRDLFGVSQLQDPVPATTVEATDAQVWFVGLSGKFTFEPERLRADRRHRLRFDGRHLGSASDSFWLLEGDYRHVFEFGWNELWIRNSAAAVIGNYEVADAIPMRFLRGAFGNDFYLDRAASLLLDFRFSLKREDFKIGVFSEAAVMREAAGSPSAGDLRYGASFGPSFHALVLDVFQFDLSYAFGFLDDGTFDYGISLHLEKAF